MTQPWLSLKACFHEATKYDDIRGNDQRYLVSNIRLYCLGRQNKMKLGKMISHMSAT